MHTAVFNIKFINTHSKLLFSNDLHLKPYKLQNSHRLETHDYEKIRDFANWCIGLGPYLKNWLKCSDEAYFYLTLSLNKHNNREWLEPLTVGGH